MTNKNDLRYIKTENLIRTTYLELIKKKKSSITVTELCKDALINKSTFYAHYESIDNLHSVLCSEKIHEIFSECDSGITMFFSNTKTCIEAIFSQFIKYRADLVLLFPNWMDMILPLEEKLLSIYEQVGISNEQKNALRFCIGGILHLMSMKDIQNRKEAVILLSQKCIKYA